MTPNTAMILFQMFDSLPTNLREIELPLCFINSAKDDRVDNAETCAMHKLAQNSETELHEIQGADHTNIVFEYPYVLQATKLALDFFEKLL